MLDNSGKVFKKSKKTDNFCPKPRFQRRPFCPQKCSDDGFCYEQVCNPYSPCEKAGGKILLVNSVSFKMPQGVSLTLFLSQSVSRCQSSKRKL